MVEKTSAIEIQRESAINKTAHSSAAHNHHVKGWKLDVVVRERSEVINSICLTRAATIEDQANNDHDAKSSEKNRH